MLVELMKIDVVKVFQHHCFRYRFTPAGEDRTSRNLGCPTDVRTAGLARRHCNSELAAVEDV